MIGMAPRARIAAYKGLWTSGTLYPGSDYGTAVDLLAALDDAVSECLVQRRPGVAASV